MLTSRWLGENYNVDKPAKGLDNSGVIDDCDMIVNSKKVEIKSATKNYFKFKVTKGGLKGGVSNSDYANNQGRYIV